MRRLVLTAGFAMAVAMASTVAHAKRHHAPLGGIVCTDRGCTGAVSMHRHVRKRGRHITARRRFVYRTTSAVGGLPGAIVAKVGEIANACPGFHITSGFRPGARVAGTNRPSLHAANKAADIAGGNFSCAYSHLTNWPGGVSTDARSVHHIHFSYDPGGREWGARFAHGGRTHRHARRRGLHRQFT